MTVSQALRRGIIDLARSRRMVLLFYAAATLPAIIGAAVVMTIPLLSLGRSTWTEAMAGNLDLTWVAETIAQSALPAVPLVAALACLAAFGRVLQLFLLGGALQTFGGGQPFSATVFFAGCGRNFWRMVRLALFSLLFFAAALALQGGINFAGNKMWGEGNEATPLVYWSWFSYSVLAILLALCSLAFDYAAIRLVTEDSRKAVRAYLGAFRLIWRAPVSTLVLCAVIWIIALLLLAGYAGISQMLPQTSGGLVILLFGVRQGAVLARSWCRLLFYSSQCAMYAGLCPPAPPLMAVPEPELLPESEPLPELGPLLEPDAPGAEAETESPAQPETPSPPLESAPTPPET